MIKDCLNCKKDNVPCEFRTKVFTEPIKGELEFYFCNPCCKLWDEKEVSIHITVSDKKIDA